MIGRIKRVPLREVWKNEAKDFTPWLMENIDYLSDVLPFDLSSAEREINAGTFSVDIVAEDNNGDPVVIENQLEKSNHDHLGKVLTYLSNMEAKTAIWIVSETRSEHINAISWLNESGLASFYLVKIEAVKIGDSEVAPLFTLIVGPSDESLQVGKSKKVLADKQILIKKFWTELLEYSNSKTTLFSNILPSNVNWIQTASGVSGLNYLYNIRKDDTYIDLYIDKGKDKEEETKEIFNTLLLSKSEIEMEMGRPMNWSSREGKRACRIMIPVYVGSYLDENKWSEIHEAMVNAMIQMVKVFEPYLKKLIK